MNSTKKQNKIAKLTLKRNLLIRRLGGVEVQELGQLAGVLGFWAFTEFHGRAEHLNLLTTTHSFRTGR